MCVVVVLSLNGLPLFGYCLCQECMRWPWQRICYIAFSTLWFAIRVAIIPSCCGGGSACRRRRVPAGGVERGAPSDSARAPRLLRWAVKPPPTGTRLVRSYFNRSKLRSYRSALSVTQCVILICYTRMTEYILRRWTAARRRSMVAPSMVQMEL